MSFSKRLLQELAAAGFKAEARQVIKQAGTEIDKMEPHAKEQLLAELQDLIVELPN